MTPAKQSKPSEEPQSHKKARYEQIALNLRDQINSRMKPGDFLDPEVSLAEQYEVNRHTIRRAIDELENDGLVWRQQGRGTLVLQPPIDYQIHSQTRFTETIASLGLEARSVVVGRRVLKATQGVSHWLKIEGQAPVVQIDALRLADGQPILLSTHFLPCDPFEPVYLDYEGGSLHRYLAERFQIALKRMESVITSRLPGEEDAMALRMSPRMPILRVKSLNVDSASGRPVEYVISRFRSDRVQFKVEP